jgi:ubiquinone/menaquinone biosynthesis C-methylase UbiE
MSLWGRVFASLYDRSLAAAEEAGLRERRVTLLADARGRVLEVGAGTGLNLAHYPDGLEDLVLTEPEEPMARRLERKLGESGLRSHVVRSRAESLPFPDRSFDTVVCTLVLCTVPDQRAALAEIERVLRPGGQLLFLEHVRSEEPGLARWQDRLTWIWRRVGHGCHPNRSTAAAIERSGLALAEIERGELAKAPPFVRPLITGRAVAS